MVNTEYTRDGLNFQQWYDNICRVLTELPLTKVTIMCTTGLLSFLSTSQTCRHNTSKRDFTAMKGEYQ